MSPNPKQVNPKQVKDPKKVRALKFKIIQYIDTRQLRLARCKVIHIRMYLKEVKLGFTGFTRASRRKADNLIKTSVSYFQVSLKFYLESRIMF